MRTFTIDQYKRMAARFNNMSFLDKIKTIKEHSDILTLASDHNWWVVKAKDNDIQEQLEEAECEFHITNEWDSNEIHDLIALLELPHTGL